MGCSRKTAGAGSAGSSREHAAGDAADAESGHIIELVRLAREDGAGRAQPAADRRPDPLPQVAGRKSGRIPGDEGVAAPHDLHTSAQVVAVAARIVAGAAGEGTLERLGEIAPVPADVVP